MDAQIDDDAALGHPDLAAREDVRRGLALLLELVQLLLGLAKLLRQLVLVVVLEAEDVQLRLDDRLLRASDLRPELSALDGLTDQPGLRLEQLVTR